MSRFVTPIVLRMIPGIPIKKKPYQVNEELIYRTDVLPTENFIKIPAGYRTDLASIPRMFWRIIPPCGEYQAAAVVHDYLCDVVPKICSSVEAAEVFEEAMLCAGVPGWKVAVMVWAVKRFGPKFQAADYGGGKK